MTVHAMNAPIIVWFKRDLRLTDHGPLAYAIASKRPIILLYLFEPELLGDPHYDVRHWRFVWQSLEDMQQRLETFQIKLHIRLQSALDAFHELHLETGFCELVSSEEIGLGVTFERDLALKKWCHEQNIHWREWPQGAVIRGLTQRDDWDKRWQKTMRQALNKVDLNQGQWCELTTHTFTPPSTWLTKCKGMQTGGSTLAWQTLDSFYQGRGQEYYRQISSPQLSRTACSRLSPYLAWGNISLREVYQDLLSRWHTKGWRRSLIALSSRIHWHCHFMQKFESECEMEWRPVNHAYRDFPYRQDDQVLNDLGAWQQGLTGFPLVDACMRALQATGYLNFRMRAMLVSFLCHHLNIDWRLGVHHLARLFLDFEPGIHYPQFQMQAGITGANTIRIYNPVKQSLEQDPDGHFIRRWVPELQHVPTPILHTPWEMTAMEETLYQCQLGQDYPQPMIALEEAAQAARQRLWGYRQRADVRHEKQRILSVHVRPASANSRGH